MASKAGSSSGPEWMDVALMMTEVGVLHKSSVSLVMRPDGAGHSSAMEVEAFAVREGHLGTEVGYSVSVKYRVLTGRPGVMPTAVYRLLYELDRMCSATFWHQEMLKP